MTEYEKNGLLEIQKICDNFSESKVHDLYSLASRFDYMRVERNELFGGFKRFQSLKRRDKKAQAWSYVTDQVYRLRTIAGSAISCKDAMD
jgi:hypothetical protein